MMYNSNMLHPVKMPIEHYKVMPIEHYNFCHSFLLVFIFLICLLYVNIQRRKIIPKL